MDGEWHGQSEAMAVAKPTPHALHYVQGVPFSRVRAEHAPYNYVRGVPLSPPLPRGYSSVISLS